MQVSPDHQVGGVGKQGDILRRNIVLQIRDAGCQRHRRQRRKVPRIAFGLRQADQLQIAIGQQCLHHGCLGRGDQKPRVEAAMVE